MGNSVVIAERNAVEFGKKLHPPQPFFDRRFEFSL
jgi:hypothetical protein